MSCRSCSVVRFCMKACRFEIVGVSKLLWYFYSCFCTNTLAEGSGQIPVISLAFRYLNGARIKPEHGIQRDP